MHTGPPGVISQESKVSNKDIKGELGENQYIPLTFSVEAEDNADGSNEEYDTADTASEGEEEMVEFNPNEKGQLQALRGGSCDSLFDTHTKWNKSWEDGISDKQEKCKLPQEDRGDNLDGNHRIRSPSSKETRTNESEKRDNNEDRVDAATTKINEENLIEEVKVMEASDLKKLKKPTRALCMEIQQSGRDSYPPCSKEKNRYGTT